MRKKKIVSDEEDDVQFQDVVARCNDDEEDDEDGLDGFEKDDFIGDDFEEEEQERADNDEERHKKKKKRKKRESAHALDEDDWELLHDNNTVHHLSKDIKKFKRLKKVPGDSDEERLGFSGGKGGRTAKEKLNHSLFGDDDGVPLEDVVEEEQQVEDEEDRDIGEDDDEMADFIVDEEVDETGAGLRQKKVKKKKIKKVSGVSSSALQEAHDLFGDVGVLLQHRKRDLESAEWKERRLEDEFEPIVLSEKYMSQKDDQIWMSDTPERMQIYEENTGSAPMDDTSISEESDWIYNQLISGVPPFSKCAGTESSTEGEDLPIDKKHIVRFLELNHVQKLDIPFIAMYRKEECMSLLKDPEQLEDDQCQDKSEDTSSVKLHKVLWAIHDLDMKWLLLQKRKTALYLCYNRRFEEESQQIYDDTRLNLNQQLIESILESLRVAESEREVDDIDAKFNLHFPPNEVGVDEGQYKRPKRRSLYSECYKAGLLEMASKFGVSPEQLGQQLSLKRMVDALKDPKETPEDIASSFTCAQFETPQAVLKGAMHMTALEISCEPSIRKHIRSFYLDHAVVSTSPTPDGNGAIDPFHQFAGVKWLREKPISKFVDSQWLLIQKAEVEKLLQVTFKLPDHEMNKLVTDLKEQYLSDGVSKSAQLWNEQRNLILHDAIHTFLLPSMEKEARQLLTTRAKNWVVWEYGKALWDKISVGPFQTKRSDAASDDEAAPRVMACCWGPGKPTTTFVMLDSFGQVLDVLYAGSLTLRSQNVNDQQRKRNDQQRVLRFMTDHQPNVVVLGAVNLSCTKLKEDIYEIIYKMIEENPGDVGHEMNELSIVYGDESLPRLYENSQISSDQLTGQPGIVKRAVALGRYLQNPLAMVATLCGPGREILSWKISPLQNFLNSFEKFTMIEHVMADVTSQVGLDINLALGHEWLFAPLQFISGLGPRKAASLKRSLVRAGPVFSRKDFLTAHGLGKKVFFNSVGFLRVRRSGLATNKSQFIDLLDDTRIHPESYGLAQEMAKDVYKMDNGDVNDDDDGARLMAIEHVREQPSFLKALKLDEYVADKKRENKKETLKDIKRELIHGFQDHRKQYKEPNQDEEFYMVSGETEGTLVEGKIVQATVRRVQGPKAMCALESGLTGILTKEDYADDWRDIVELSDRLHEGDILTCKIKSIMKNRYQVFLVSRENEMRSSRYQQVQDFDPYYQEDRISLQNEQDKARKQKELANKHFKPRMIIHPRFQNITADEAIEFLSHKEAGESIIRPSLRGPSYLTLTLKVYEGVYAHKDIAEGGKELKDITSLLHIGKTLKIGEDTFEDLDEIMDRYVHPLVLHLKAMLSYRKFKRGTKAEVDELLRTEKLENKMRIVYTFGISHEHPGTFILTYIRTMNPRHEYVGLSPKGFKYRRRMFEDIDHLVAYFQNHIDDPLHEPAPSIRSVAATVPMKGPNEGDGWVGSNERGWGVQSSDQDGKVFIGTHETKENSRLGPNYASCVGIAK